jgi:hypothetical protein
MAAHVQIVLARERELSETVARLRQELNAERAAFEREVRPRVDGSELPLGWRRACSPVALFSILHNRAKPHGDGCVRALPDRCVRTRRSEQGAGGGGARGTRSVCMARGRLTAP